ncbi:MAG: polysaccharide biosynthesis protein [Prevotella sp.]|nr:polysaccharide biosynthesis protein [Prevotella sp.]
MNPFGKLFNWYFNKNALPYWCIFLFDSFILLLSGLISHGVFNYWSMGDENFGMVMCTLLLFVLLSSIGSKVFYTYTGILRYSSFVDLLRVGYANALSCAIVLTVHYWMNNYPEMYFKHLTAREIVVMFALATMIQWAARILVKNVFDVLTSSKRSIRVLIYGAMSGGVGIAKNIRSQKPTRYKVKGFITHDGRYRHNRLLGEKVYSLEDNLADVIHERHIEGIIVSPYRTNEFRNQQELQDMLIENGVKIFMAQNAQEWVNIETSEYDDKLEESPALENVQLQEVSVEDLLPRAEIVVDMDSVRQELKGKRVMITGAAGSIGSEMVRQVAGYKPALMILIDQAETPEHDVRLMMAKEFPDVRSETIVTSICKKDRMERIFADYLPDYVFHAAAYKHVPMMENNPTEAVQNNIEGTKIIADLAVKYGTKKFVMVSTDKAVNPTNVMGCSKRICEIYVQSLSKVSKTQFVTTRFGNVLGSNGSVIPLFREQIKNGGPVTVTHPNIIRYFMLIPEACKLVLEAGTKGKGGEIFVFDMGKPVKIADLAQRMIKLSGAKNVRIQYTGLRAGEKLYEEMLNEEENTKPSFHEKIRIAQVREYDYKQVLQDVDELIAISGQFDDLATVKKMKAIVPEYKSNNSIYEQLDRKSV